MMGLILGAALLTGPQGNTYIQPTDNGYNIWSQQGITTVRDYNGWQQIKQPDGTVRNVIDLAPGAGPDLSPVLGPVLGPEVEGVE